MAVCPSGKRNYLFRADAETAIQKFARRRGFRALYCYQCERCSLWHLTKQNRVSR